MTEIAIRPASDVVGAFDPNDEKVLQYLGFSPTDPRACAVVAVARRYDLDPLLKHIIVIPGSGVYITRDGLLHTAHSSGLLDGILVDQEPTLSDDGKEWVARVSVYRKDMRFPFTFPGRYPVNGRNREYAPEMALKAAEAHALRRAFDVTGLPTEDEQRPPFDAAAPQQRVTGDSIRARTAPAQEWAPQADSGEVPPAETSGAEGEAGSSPASTTCPESITKPQLKKLHTVFSAIGWTDRQDRLRAASLIVCREVSTSTELTKAEASGLIDTLDQVAGQPDPAMALAELLANIRGEQPVDAEVVEDGEG